jgi:hypothetical protein
MRGKNTVQTAQQFMDSIAAHRIINGLGIAAGFYQIIFAQFCQMLGQGRLGNPDNPLQFPDTFFATTQGTQNQQTAMV